MKNSFLSFLALALSLFSFSVFSQTESKTESKPEVDTTLLGLPGDNLDLYAVMDLFQHLLGSLRSIKLENCQCCH